MRLMETGTPTLYCASCLTTFGSDGEACPNLTCGEQRPESGWGQMYEPGDTIDRNYRVTRRLALGGAGVTYLVRSIGDDGEASGPEIALKLLFASRDHGAYLRRLSTEAQILQELDHPNIVQYLGFVHRTGQSPYLLTRFEAGGSFLDHMRRVGTLTVREAAGVGLQVCLALEKGHAQGIIHRDMKPENLLLKEVTLKGETPEVRVADFGIARVVGSVGSGLTRAGAFVGTPQYAAPEQFLGQVASDKADVYSLGAVLVFLMTARPLVEKAHTMAPEDVYTRLMDVLPPSIQRPDDSEADCDRMNAVLASSMHVDPDQRCTVEQLAEMLRTLLDGEDIQLVPPGKSSVDALVGNDTQEFIEIQTSQLSETISDQDDKRSMMAETELGVQPDLPQKEAVSPSHDVDPSAETVIPPAVEPLPDNASRQVLTFVGLVVGVVCAALLGLMFFFVPWHMDSLPVVGVTYPDAGTSDANAMTARTAVSRTIRKRSAELREGCSLEKLTWFNMEFGVNASGSIRWARPLTSQEGAGCISRALRWDQTTATMKGPVKVQLKFNL